MKAPQILLVGLLMLAPASAWPFDARVVGDVIHVQPGLVVSVTAVFSNSSSSRVYLNGLSTSIDDKLATGDYTEPFSTWAPASLGPGESWEGPILILTIAPDAPHEVIPLALTVLGGDNAWDGDAIGDAWFSIDDATAVSSVPDAGDAAAALRVRPNPFRDALSISFAVPEQANLDVSVFDVAGRLVRSLHSGDMPAGPAELRWDGLESDGGRAGRGIYFIRVTTGSTVLKTKVVKID